MTKTAKFDNMCVVTALIEIIKQSKDSHLSDEFWQSCEAPLAYLRSQLGLTNIQIVFVAILLENDYAMVWSDFASHLDITNFEVRTYANEMDELVNKGWLIPCQGDISYRDEMGYKLVPEAVATLLNNQVFVPEPHTTTADDDSVEDDDDDDNDDNDAHNDCNRDTKQANGLLILKKHTEIPEKALFFNPTEQKQVSHLANLLSPKKFSSIQRRLEAQNMRKGFACLFYGGPGTGKTETVLQIARQTGRDIIQVNFSQVRSSWVGESEKNTKAIFDYYRAVAKNTERVPILLFNEADTVIGKRNKGVMEAVDKMENAMQNIILQEMEDFDGILIATTNLMGNFDSAFERRFLYKIEFNKPETEVKAKIWSSMLKRLSKKDALHLASHFDFSGGQIENIARKRAVDYIIYGKYASIDEIEDYCRAEALNSKDHKKEPKRIGFII